MNMRWALIAASLAITACANTAPSLRPQNTSVLMREAPERFIVVTVANEGPSLVTRAGSTPRAYGGSRRYAVSSTARASVAAIAREYGLKEVAAWPIAALRVHCVVFQIPDEVSRVAVLARLAHEPRVALAQPLATFATMSQAYNDPYLGLQHAFEQLEVGHAHRWSRGEGVRVAIIDTGVDTRHPELQRRVVATGNFVDADTAQFRDDRHGTQVAGVIAALANNKVGIVGVAPGVSLVALKACWQLQFHAGAAHCNSFTLAQALAAAMDQGVQVINLSLTGPADPLLAALVSAGVRRGIVFVGSAPPPAMAAEEAFPSSLADVLVVNASEAPGVRARTLLAPGREILTLMPQGHYDFASGPSLATAQVTGTVALILAHNRRMDSAALFDLLRRTTTRSPGNQPIESINACAALASITGQEGCGPAPAVASAGMP